MHITHLSLANFRNYRRLELDLPSSVVVIQGDNAQGKTNLLESIHLMATTKSHRASTDRELLHHDAMSEDMPVARVCADAQRDRGQVRLEFALRVDRTSMADAAAAPDSGNSTLPLRKQVRVNGIARRSADFVGQVNVVMFNAQDIDLVTGRAALCRRYLDLVCSQLDSIYLRALQRYQKVLMQRNHLLRLLQEGQAQPDQLEFWDNELVQSGSYLIMQRWCLVQALNEHARELHRQISGGAEDLHISYAPNVMADDSVAQIESGFRETLQAKRKREILQGITLAGPHRDSLQFQVNGVDATRFGSRGQQQTVALSLKLAEAKHMQATVNDYPVILLDDVFSELDLHRRQHLLALVTLYQQVLITATELDYFDPSFLAGAARFKVSRGNVVSA